MAKTDPERERQRLADYYSRQLDGALEKVAGEAYDLSDAAKEVLRSELAKRHLSVELAQQPGLAVKKAPQPCHAPEEFPSEGSAAAEESPASDREAEGSELVTIRVFRDLPEALLAKGSLDSSGIQCALMDDNMVRLDWFISNLLGGIKLKVKAEDADAADEILSQPSLSIWMFPAWVSTNSPGVRSADRWTSTFRNWFRRHTYRQL
ncbi:MAG TPA: hypothetical protein VJP02_08835 [Candidatus Sulfotelmatobacter sp.]|nr:hypothetical protein [Candidatus Sulfotelmatobacter sp.]